MHSIRTTAAALAGSTMILAGAGAFAQDWTPDRPINIIVPWGAGGATDQVSRATAPILAEALGTDVVVVNQPGASGAVGTQEVLSANADGHTLLANAIADAATYSVTGLIEGTSIANWHVYTTVANVAVVSVPADSPYEDFGALLDAFKSDGGNVTVATSGVTSAGGTAIATLSEAGDFEYNLVAYDGGAAAAVAAASGESMVTTQLAGEQAELIRGGRLRALAVLSDQPLEMEGTDPIPAVTDWLPDSQIAYQYFGILVPKDAPDEVVATMDAVWTDSMMNSDALRSYALNAGALFDPASGEEAIEKVTPGIVAQACAAVERGDAVNDPSSIGVDCEAETLTLQ